MTLWQALVLFTFLFNLAVFLNGVRLYRRR